MQIQVPEGDLLLSHHIFSRACIIAAASSGSGKTTVSLGIMRALSRKGLRVRPFKAGPDYLDGTYHALAAGNTSYNLDTWMIDAARLNGHFRSCLAGRDIGVVEGVMGLYDGFEGTMKGSTADLARMLNIPVILLVDCKGMSGSVAPLVSGFKHFRKDVHPAGVILNRTGSERHVRYLKEALAEVDIAIVGHLPRNEELALEHRHLGLFAAQYGGITEEKIGKIADAVEKTIDLDLLIRLCGSVEEEERGQRSEGRSQWAEDRGRKSEVRGQKAGRAEKSSPGFPSTLNLSASPRLRVSISSREKCTCRIAVARDDAFHFYYQANLDMLEAAGAELVFFSPLKDATLPRDINGLLLGGGYPEEHAVELAKNESLRQSVRDFSLAAGCIYAECGGYMYLGDHLEKDGKCLPMCGVFPVGFSMNEGSRKSLGYREITLAFDTVIGPAGTVMRGHEFHYSSQKQIISDKCPAPFMISPRNASAPVPAGMLVGKTIGSYMHIHFLSCPELANCFVTSCMAGGKT
jgi:cobyrinic acid a,c-diamide synthase